MATAKKTTKKTEQPKEEPKEQPKEITTEQTGMSRLLASFDFAKKGEDRTAVTLRDVTPDEYIAAEYPWFQTSQNIPQLLKALLREVVKGRMK